MKRLNLSLDDIVYEDIENFCKERNCSKSGLVATACTAYISAMRYAPKMQEDINELREALSELQKSIDEQTK